MQPNFKRAISNILQRSSYFSLFYKMFYGIVIIVFLIISISSIISFIYLHAAHENEAMDNASRLVNNINIGFQDNLDQVNRIIMSIYSDTGGTDSSFSMQDVISTEGYNSVLDEYTALKVTKDFFQRLIFLRKDFNSIYIYVSSKKTFSYSVNGANKLGYDPSEEAWFKDTVRLNGKTLISAPHIPYQLKYSKEVISFSRLLKSAAKENTQPNSIVLMDLSLDSINNIIDKVNLNEKTGVLFLDKTCSVIYKNNIQYSQKDFDKDFYTKVQKDSEGKFTATLLNKKILVAFNTSEVTGWKLITLTPYSEVNKDDQKILLFYIILMFIALVITLFISYGFSKIIFKPIKRLQRGIVKVKEGNFDFQIEKFPKDELGQLILSFNSMIITIKKLIIEKYEERIARKDAEFKYLQSQINPHFIYNTLQIISSMAVVKKVPEISSVSKNLAKMLRYSIDGKNKIIAIKDELENLTYYIEIQKLRFKDFLNYKINIEECVYEYSILKLVLQPIVENAVTHGIEAKGLNGIIEISAMLVGNEIHFNILDNGRGMTKGQISLLLQKINETDENEDKPVSSIENSHNSVGLKNINQRIKLIYGQEYGIEIESIEGEWTKVTVKVPARRLIEEKQND